MRNFLRRLFSKRERRALPQKRDRYIRARREGRVESVQRGVVVIDERMGGGPHTVIYDNLACTHVQPGQHVEAGQVVGAWKRR